MKFPVAKLLPELVKHAAMARENHAATCLRTDLVRGLVFEATRAGHYALRIKVPDGIDVRGCVATEEFEAWAKKEGLRVDWEKRGCDLPDGRHVEILEPVISWAPDK